MKLRKLKESDAPLMLEWMHDEDVIRDLKADFSQKTIDDCIGFIHAADDTSENCHLAIVDDNDEYMGTVSLKHIHDADAEFGISMRKSAMGKGMSRAGMQMMIEIGFNEYHLEKIFWCVDPVNRRAVRFYDKNGYSRCAAPSQAQGYSNEEKENYLWYEVIKEAE